MSFKKPIAKVNMGGGKRPTVAFEEPDYNDKKAAWRLGRVQISDPYGWHVLTSGDVSRLRERLGSFEKSSWKDLFVRDARNNHRINSSDLKCPTARNWMAQNLPDQPYLWTLRINAKERIWGILAEDAYQVIFWDPEHLIWEVNR